MKRDETFHAAARRRLKKTRGSTQAIESGVEMLGIIADLLGDIADAITAMKTRCP